MRECRCAIVEAEFVQHLARADQPWADEARMLLSRPPDSHLRRRLGERPPLKPLADFKVQGRLTVTRCVGVVRRFHDGPSSLVPAEELAMSEGDVGNFVLLVADESMGSRFRVVKGDTNLPELAN